MMMACSRWSSVWIPILNLFVEQSILKFAYFQAKMPLNLAFADPNYLDVATKKRVTDEVNIGNLQAYVL